jgi:hypothetical protein
MSISSAYCKLRTWWPKGEMRSKPLIWLDNIVLESNLCNPSATRINK